MKKWLIALTIICGAGFLTSASLAGRIYFNEANVYTDYDKQNLDLSSISNVYINSDIPVSIKPTTGEAYVEFNQKFEDLLGENPAFELKVENKEKGCYINLNQTKKTEFNFMVRKNEGMLTVYLPVKALDTLEVKGQAYRIWNSESSQIDLTGINIKNVEITQDNTQISLEGKYENINLINDAGIVKINSKQKANVSIQQAIECDLQGLFDTVDVKGVYGAVKINSLEPAQVSLDGYESNIKLAGSYGFVKATGANNTLNISTDTLSNIVVENTYGKVTLEGALNNVKVDNLHSQVDIQPTTIPKSIEVTGPGNDTFLKLPSNIPGFQIAILPSNESEEQYEMYEEPAQAASSKIKSDFNLTKQSNNTYAYGDSSLKLMVEAGNGLRILDSGTKSIK